VAIGISILVIILIDNTIRLAMFSTGFIKTMQIGGGYPLVSLPNPWMSGR